MRRTFPLAVLFSLVVALSGLAAADHTTDTPEMVKKALADKKALLIDVREKTEWDEGHLKDAKFLALSTLKAGAKAEDIAAVAPKGTVVYLHCKAGGRCLQAAEILQKMGYDARPLKQGYKDLLDAGFAPAPR